MLGALGILTVLPIVLIWNGAMFAPTGCGFARAVAAVGGADDLKGNPADCTRLAFAADLPSQALATTSIVAIALWGVLRSAINRIPQRLHEEAGLDIHVRNHAESYLKHLLKWGSARRVPGAKWVSLAILAVVVARLGISFREYAETRNPMFGRLAAGNSAAVEALRNGWWAGEQASALSGVLWVSIGCVGVFFAVRTIELYILARMMARRYLRRAPLSYRPGAVDEHYGLGSFVKINDWLRACTVNFSVTAATVVFVFGSDPSSAWLGVIPVVLLVGGYVNLLALREAYTFTKTKFVEMKRSVLTQAGEGTALETSLATLPPSRLDRVRAAVVDDVVQAPSFPSRRQSGQVIGALAAAISVAALTFVVARTIL